MNLSRRWTVVICSVLAGAAWALALAQGPTTLALVNAAVATVLAASLVWLRFTSRFAAPEAAVPKKHESEAAEFRRALFDLCAALKLGVDFCERHLDSEPELLLEQLEQMGENIRLFVNEITCPVRFYSRARWPWRVRPKAHWPWHAIARGRPHP